MDTPFNYAKRKLWVLTTWMLTVSLRAMYAKIPVSIRHPLCRNVTTVAVVFDPQGKLSEKLSFVSTAVNSYIFTRIIVSAVNVVSILNRISFNGIGNISGLNTVELGKSGCIFAANHTSYLDGPLLFTFLSQPSLMKWLNPSFSNYVWTVGSMWCLYFSRVHLKMKTGCSVVFDSLWKSTISSLCHGLPIQPRIASNGFDLRSDPEKELWIELSRKYFLADIARAVKAGRNVLMFPEGRIWQEEVEMRDEEARYVPKYQATDAIRFGVQPNERLGPFYWGIGKLVARTSCRVIPVG